MDRTGPADDDRTAALQNALAGFDTACEQARAMLEATERFATRPRYRDRAYAALMEARAWAYNFAVAPRLNIHPQVYWHTTWHANVFALGQPLADFRYGGLFLDGSRKYVLRGRLGAARLLLMQVHTHLLGDPRSQEIGNYDFHNFELGPDGTFEVTVSAEERSGNHIRLHRDSTTNFILIRKIMGDWNDDLGALTIDEIDSPLDCSQAPHLDVDMAAAIADGAAFMTYLIRTYVVGLHDIYSSRAGGRRNAWAEMPGQDVATWLIGSPSVTYAPAVYEITADDALVIEWAPPDSAYWSVQLGDVWSRPLDYMHHQTDINMQRASLDGDGRFRAVICLDDPGVANWLDPTSNVEGTIVVRSYRNYTPMTMPSLTKVPRKDLLSSLPADTTMVTAAQRTSALEYRRTSTYRFFHS